MLTDSDGLTSYREGHSPWDNKRVARYMESALVCWLPTQQPYGLEQLRISGPPFPHFCKISVNEAIPVGCVVGWNCVTCARCLSPNENSISVSRHYCFQVQVVRCHSPCSPYWTCAKSVKCILDFKVLG